MIKNETKDSKDFEEINARFRVVEASRLRFNDNRFFHVDFLKVEDFIQAVLEISFERRTPIILLDAKDDTLIGYSPEVEAVYSTLCDGVILLRYYSMKPNGDDIE